MNWVQQITSAIGHIFKWWFVVQPWELSIRVRYGKKIEKFGPGIHIKWPFFDLVYIQNVRTRNSCLQPQTITTIDGKTITLCGTLRYKIEDVLKLHMTLHQPEDTIRQEVEAIITQYIIVNKLIDCTAYNISQYVADNVDLTRYGLADIEFFITDFAFVRTYRLIGGDMQRYLQNGRQIETNSPVQNGPQCSG